MYKSNEFDYAVCTNVGIYCMVDQNILWPGLKANVMLINLKLVFVVVNFLTQVMYANKDETKEKIRITWDKKLTAIYMSNIASGRGYWN